MLLVQSMVVYLQAEKLNGRAAMVGYVLALFVDQLTGESPVLWLLAQGARSAISLPAAPPS